MWCRQVLPSSLLVTLNESSRGIKQAYAPRDVMKLLFLLDGPFASLVRRHILLR